MANVMLSKDAISAKTAECFITINGNRYNFMNLINFEATIEKTKAEVPILGRVMRGHKTVGLSGSFSGTAHYNTSVLRKLLVDYKNTGIDTYFEIQITNEDPASAAGRQTIVLLGCTTNGGTLAKFDADGEYLDEEIEGTFEDFKMPEEFRLLMGM
jgi:hypothetical protein